MNYAPRLFSCPAGRAVTLPDGVSVLGLHVVLLGLLSCFCAPYFIVNCPRQRGGGAACLEDAYMLNMKA